MTANDLLAALDLADEANGPGKPADPITANQVAAGPAAQEHVLKMDDWGQRRGRDILTDNPDIAQAVATNKDSGLSAQDQEYWGNAVADFHGAAFEQEPVLNEKCTDPLRQDFVKDLFDTQEFHDIRASTVWNNTASEVATAAFATQFAKRRAAFQQECQQAKKHGKPAPATGGAGGDVKTMMAAAKACATAKMAVDGVVQASEMCGLGNGAGGTSLDSKRVADVYKRVRNSPNLKKIAEAAGRFRRLAQSKQRTKTAHGVDEIVGVTIGNEIARLLPSELVKLIDPDMELETIRRLLEGETQVRETKATEPVGKGPIIVTVDESGSMTGEKIETAKALALALAWVAKKQNRWCALVGFSGGTEGTLCVLKPGRWNEVELLNWLEHFYSGGTTLDVPLAEVPGMWSKLVEMGMKRGKTDMVMITDAEVHVPEELEATFLAFKKAERVRLTTLVVQGEPGNIARVADEVYSMPAITTDSEAVGKVLSV